MDTHHNFILIFYVLFFSFFLVLFVQADQITVSQRNNRQYTQKLTSAAHSAMQSAVLLGDDGSMKEGDIFSSAAARNSMADHFFYALSDNFHLSTVSSKNIRVFVPVLLMVDNSGYYIGYNALFDKDSMASPENAFSEPMQVSEEYTFAEQVGDYKVRYFLDNSKVEVTTPQGKVFSGQRAAGEDSVLNLLSEDIRKRGGNPESTDVIRLIRDDGSYGESFEERRETLIVHQINTELAEYINHYNYANTVNEGGYHMEMPVVPDEMWHRLLKNPTLIAFLQGQSTYTGKTVINTYAYSGSEIAKGTKYFITTDSAGRMTYHSVAGAIRNGEIREGKYHGQEISMLYDSMRACSDLGAYPCQDCIR